MNSGAAFADPGFNLYGYNERNELTDSERYLGMSFDDNSQPVSSEDRAYGYDNIGNRTEAAGWDSEQSIAMQLTYTANQVNQYDLISANIGADETPVYDDDGNMTGYEGMNYTYNAENRLVSVEPQSPVVGDIRVDFTYDFMGRRVAKNIARYDATLKAQLETRNLFLYDGWNLIQEITQNSELGAQNSSFYVWGLDLSQSMQGAGGVGGLLARVSGGASHTYTYDANGNVGQLIDGGANIAAHYEYDPYGNTIKAVGSLAEGNPYRFSTKYFDVETELYYYGIRYYSPELGRWLTMDPIGERGGLNLYGFIGNNVSNSVDLFGLVLYAFDGTGNNDRNVAKGYYTHVHTLWKDYEGREKFYTKGVGSDWYSFIHGGLHGLGGQSRLEKAYKKFLQDYKEQVANGAPIDDIDIIGFSRGAALARAFVNLLSSGDII
ncbi:MAG: RHS repeat-associated core domain-containing protein [Desulfurivibrionaceae bacterium]